MVPLALLAAGLVAAATPAEDLRKLCDDYTEFRLRADPMLATAIGRNEYNDRWEDLSSAAIAAREREIGEFAKRLQAIPSSELTGEDSITARMLDRELKIAVEREHLSDGLLTVGQLFGLHNAVQQTFDRMPARTEQDYRNIIARLASLPTLIGQQIYLLQEAAASGLTQPRVVIDRVVEQLDLQLAPDAAHAPDLAAFRRFPDSFSPQLRQRLTARANGAYARYQAAWRRYRDYLAERYAARARPSVSIASVPGGAEIYRFLIHTLTTTDMSPEEIHRLGEQELTRIEGEMQGVARETGFTGSLAEFEAKLKADPTLHYRTQEEMLMDARNDAKIVEPELPRLFEHIPWMLYGVRAIPPDAEASMATHAEPPPLDHSRPGWFDLNTYKPPEQARYDKEALMLHEAVPGHLLQGAYAQANADMPVFRKTTWYPAYGEGWALYAESLGGELGLYRDPYSRFGQLASERFRAVRLVVDTGIHAMGWSREQAVQFFEQHAPEESDAEVDRYISWPAQALAYKIGQLRILQLRKLAQDELGPKFDIRDFHYAVLRHGALPLDVLDEVVRVYIAEAKAGKPLASEAPARQPLTRRLDCAGGDCELLHGAPQTAGMRSGFVRLKPGESVGWHTTGRNEESLVVLRGTGSAAIEGQPGRTFAAPNVIYIPPATKHNVTNTGGEPLEYVYVVAPAAE
jgi:uncharacterized protein (DUF885 family)/mannose-6-phosphate isomerase-like protein (cupin superfamily)